MDQIFTFILLLLSLSASFSKYIYIDQKMDWRQAQKYCQQHYTDLAPVSNERDNNELQQLASNVNEYIWIGLIRNSSDRTKWLWSGGGAPTMYFWQKYEPNDYGHQEDYGCMWESKWYDASLWFKITFFCYSAAVVTEKKTWEEALEYCREHHDDLASVASETEMLLIQKELRKHNTTEHVWIGLRFLAGDWLLMDGQEMDYEAWGEEGKPSCPHAKMRCGASQAKLTAQAYIFQTVWILIALRDSLKILTMDQIFTFILLLLSLSASFSKYIHIDQKMDWLEAQKHCQQHYTDLAPVSNERDNNELQQLASNVNEYIWIGLIRNSSDRTKWLWSGGGAPTMYFWQKYEPNGYGHQEDYGFLWKGKWYDASLRYQITTFCYSAAVVTEKKTWEEALEYCREHHDDLASVASETEMLLIQKELRKHNTTEHIWIGLRFLAGDWLLMDGQEMDYEAWGEEGKPSCPHAKMRCGASQVTVGGKGTWKAHDCEERLHFICY
ncbi:unnamed protein product [Oreochromis niloticus]|nr:unnamed protein product [Mustela putorius furo]